MSIEKPHAIDSFLISHRLKLIDFACFEMGLSHCLILEAINLLDDFDLTFLLNGALIIRGDTLSSGSSNDFAYFILALNGAKMKQSPAIQCAAMVKVSSLSLSKVKKEAISQKSSTQR